MKFQSYFIKWWTHILKWEAALTPNVSDEVWQRKGVVNDPADAGGLTNKGITWNTYRTLAPRLKLPTSQPHFLNLSKSDHKAVVGYFWSLARPDLFKSGRIVSFFAEEYWGGGGGAIKFYQREFNTIYGTSLSVDGKIGNQTAGFVNSLSESEAFNMLLEMKEHRYTKIIAARPANQKFAQGWKNRREDFKKVFKKKFQCKSCGHSL